MSVLIKGMEMPKTCADCELLQIQSTDDWVGKYCPLVKRYIDFLEATEHRYVDCPIVAEIQEPHGDLIDRDALNIGDYEREDDDTGTLEISLGGLLEVYHRVKDAPAIIARGR